MAIRVECDNCFNEFRTKDEHAGRRMKCPECGNPIEIQAPLRRPGPTRSRTSGRPAKKRKQAQSALPPWAFAVGGAGAMLIVGLIAMLMTGGSGSQPAPEIAEQSIDAPVDTTAPSVPPPRNENLTASAEPARTPDSTDGSGNSNLQAANTSTDSPSTPLVNGTIQTTSTTSPSTSIPAVATDASITTPSGSAAAPTDSTARREEPFDSLADLIEAVEPSVVRINIYAKAGGGNGSGYIIDKEGTLVTNRHVIEGATKVTGVFQGDETEYPITGVYSINAPKDIAILKIDCPPEKLHPLVISDAEPRKGTELVAFGAPLGLDFTASEGILSAIRKASDLAKMGMTGHEGLWFQHTVPISPGNSGGPLVNMKGELIGMNTMQFTIGQNLNFAISAADVTEELAKKSSVKPLESDTVPVLAKASSNEPSRDVEDITGTEQANEYLAKLDKMTVLMLAFGFDPTRRVTSTVRSDVEDAVRKAKIRLSSNSEARMFVGMKLTSASGAAGTQAVTIVTMVHVLDMSGPSPVVYKIWDEEEKAGTVAGRAFLQGVVPDRLRDGIKKHFRKFSGAVNRNRLLMERKKKAAKTVPGTR